MISTRINFNRPDRTSKLATLAFSVIALILVAVSLFSFLGAQKVENEYEALVGNSLKKLRLVSDIHNNEEDIYLAITSQLNTPDSALQEQYRADILKAKAQNKKDSERLKELLLSSNSTNLFKKYIKYQSTYHAQIDHFLSLSGQSRSEESIQYYNDTLLPTYTVHQEYLHKLSEQIRGRALIHGNNALSTFKKANFKFNLMLLLAFAGLVASGFLIQKFILQLKRDNALLNSEIRERQQLENALIDSQQQYKALFNSNPIPTLVLDRSSLALLDVNDAACQEYGYTREEFSHLHLADLLHEKKKKQFDHATTHGDLCTTNLDRVVHKRKDGTQFYVSVESHLLPVHGGVAPLLMVATNVHEQVQTLERLEKSEKQLLEVSSSIPGAVYQFQMDAQGSFRFNFISEGIEHVFGVSAQELYNDAEIVKQYLHPDDIDIYYKSIITSYKTLQPWELEFRTWQPLQHKFVWIKGQSLPSEKGDGVVIWNGTVIDIDKEKEAQKKLLESEANLLALLDSSPQAIYLLDANLRIISYNAAAAYDVKEHLLKEIRTGQSILDYIADIHVSETVQAHLKAFKGETTIYERRQGNLWFQVSFRPVKAPDNRVLAVALNIENVSEQKQTLETIRKSELQLERAQEMANLGNWEFDVKDSIISWSDNVYKIYGINKKYYKPALPSVDNYTHPDDRKFASEAFYKSVEQKSTLKMEYRIIRPDGNVRNVICIGEVIQDDTGRATKVWGSLQDITDRKNAEREVLEAKNLLQSTLENIPEIIFSTDAALNLTYVSPQSNEILGFAAHELKGNSDLWTKGIHREDIPLLIDQTIPKLLAGQKQQLEVRAFTREGAIKWLLLRMSPLLNKEGELIRIDGSAADMTYYKNAEAKRNELTEQLTIQNQNLQQFAYIVSHNLRAPIANILGLTTIYDRVNQASEINSKVIDNLVKSAQLLDSTIHDLNDLLTLRNEINSLKESIKFDSIFSHVKESLHDEIIKAEAQIEIDFNCAPELVTVKSYIQSIMHNLVSNALKYRAEGRNLQLKVKTFKVPDYICLAVCDNGLGIDLEKERGKIFGLYKRFHHSIEGKGLGLHLVKTQAELLGGKVDVESNLNVGSTFSVYFKV